MIRLLQWLFFGHVHKWKTIDVSELTVEQSNAVGRRYTQECEHCGIVVKRDLI